MEPNVKIEKLQVIKGLLFELMPTVDERSVKGYSRSKEAYDAGTLNSLWLSVDNLIHRITRRDILGE